VFSLSAVPHCDECTYHPTPKFLGCTPKIVHPMSSFLWHQHRLHPGACPGSLSLGLLIWHASSLSCLCVFPGSFHEARVPAGGRRVLRGGVPGGVGHHPRARRSGTHDHCYAPGQHSGCRAARLQTGARKANALNAPLLGSWKRIRYFSSTVSGSRALDVAKRAYTTGELRRPLLLRLPLWGLGKTRRYFSSTISGYSGYR